MKGIIGQKIGMSQFFKDDKLIPVTVLLAGPCTVTGIRDNEKDGYNAIQIGFGDANEKKINKPLLGQFAKQKIKPKKNLVEMRTEEAGSYKIGQEITVELFKEGEKTNITGISKGKGFAGPMKRWNFKGQGASHGAHRTHRAPGSIGASATPSRVFPGKRMAGQLGNKRVTVKNLQIVDVDTEKNLIILKGAVPGPNGSVVFIRTAS